MLGREPRQVTTYEYDEGRLVRAITVREPEWLEEDREWALAQMLDADSRCPGCGLPVDETVGPDNDGRWEAPPPAHCHACEVVVARKKEWDGFEVADKLFSARRRD